MKLWSKVFNRLYGDYFMPSRLPDYERLIIAEKKVGYRQLPVRDAWSEIDSGKTLNRVVVHRHDIDTDVKTARKIFDIERKHGITSTYYFRLSTLDIKLMREIEDFGGEASYHYEEVASYAKRNHIKSPNALKEKINIIRAEFLRNLHEIRECTGLPCVTVAAHGDFANRKLGVFNDLILQDLNFRSECKIALESYDSKLINNFTVRISDKPFPCFWSPHAPYEALETKVDSIFLLTHPRQWKSSFFPNTRENFVRLYEGLIW